MAGIGNSLGALVLPLASMKEIGFALVDNAFLVFTSRIRVDGVPLYARIKPDKLEGQTVTFGFVTVNAGHFPGGRYQFPPVFRVGPNAELTLAEGIVRNLRTQDQQGINEIVAFVGNSLRAKKGLARTSDQTPVSASTSSAAAAANTGNGLR